MSRKKNDYYPSPQSAINAIIKTLEKVYDTTVIGRNTLEPSAGNGNIIQELIQKNWCKKLTAVEIEEKYQKILIQSTDKLYCPYDYMRFVNKYAGIKKYSMIISNPPYCLAERFVERSFEILEPNGIIVFLLETAFTDSKGRIKLWHYLNKRWEGYYPLSHRPSFTGNGQTAHAAYAWYIWINAKRARFQKCKVLTK